MVRNSAYVTWVLFTIVLVGLAINMNPVDGVALAEPQNVTNQSNPQTLLFVQTKPAGAEIRLEGKALGESDGIFPVEPGTYKIVIDLSGHEPNEQQITIRKGRITRIELTLDKKGKSAPDEPPPTMDRLLNDKLLTELQKAFRDSTETQMAGVLVAPGAESLQGAEREKKETEWIEQLDTLPGRARIPAMNGLVLIGSSKATPALLKIAANRAEGDNRDRWVATRALGIIGDRTAIPDLVHLTYHYNLNTRFWAQISLVRLTGKNFEKDFDAWRKWWKKEGGKPAISEERIEWTSNPEWADPAKQEEFDRDFFQRAKARNEGTPPRASFNQGIPPRVIATIPSAGETNVDPDLEYIEVTFNQDMAGGYSFTGGGPNYPTIPEGKGAVWKDRRTCVLPVRLEEAHFYRVGFNSKSFQNFRSEAGIPAFPSAIYFTTKGASEDLKNQIRVPKLVSITPENGAKDVDPNVSELRVTFDMPMGKGCSWTGGGQRFPEVPQGGKPTWSEDGKTCVLPVKLKPGWDYFLGLNSQSHKNFQSKWGVPFEPIVYQFSTRKE